jgi:AbiTii-like protein
MSLVDEIIELASDGKRSVADVLRKCLVLAFDLRNEKLKTWVENELNGFEIDDDVPEYRNVMLHSKGTFSGPFGAGIRNQPLPVLGIFEPEHLELLTTKLRQPISAYEASATSGRNPIIPWPPDLTAHYQSSFISGYSLASAWQVLPNSQLVGLCDEVRNRILRFALEIREELGLVHDKPSAVPAKKIEAAVVNHIYGGTNVIAGTASNFAQIGTIHVVHGDLAGFADALKSLGIGQKDVEEATAAVLEDGQPSAKTLGQKTAEWMKTLGGKLGEAGLKIGTGAAQQLVTKWVLQYWNLG